MRRRRRNSPEPAERQDLTSMIDVVFLLLVFFVCTMSFRVIEGKIDTELPKNSGPNSGPTLDLLEPLAIHIALESKRSSGFTVHIGGQVRDIDRLAGVVAGAVAQVPEIRVHLSTGVGVTYGHVVAVIDEVLLGGITQIHFVG
jgi:biopolymer transport protein ExbD